MQGAQHIPQLLLSGGHQHFDLGPEMAAAPQRGLQRSGCISGNDVARSRWIEEHDAIPDDLMAKARELGLFGITIPEEYGGSGLDLAGKCAIEEELGRSNYAFSTIIANHTVTSIAVKPT